MRHIKEFRNFDKDDFPLHEKLADVIRKIIPGLKRSGEVEAAKNLEKLSEPENAEKVKDNLFKKTARFAKDTWTAIKREGAETKQALEILQRMVQGESVSDNEKKFLKAQAGDVAKMLPLVAIQGIPVPFPITPLLVVLGKKYNIDILPKDHRHLLNEDVDTDVDLSKTKVVSKDGTPMTVYHGTKRKFDKFDMSWFGQTDEGFYGRGFYFTVDKEYAHDYGPMIVDANLDVRNPFWLRTWSAVGSYAELDLRDDLAKLKGMPSDLKTNREIPDGYKLNRREDDNEDLVVYSVHPKPELYGTDKEEYGPEVRISKAMDKNDKEREGYMQMAISDFNDMMNGVSYNSGLANWLLQKFDRYNFTDLLEKNGYDGLFIIDHDEMRADNVSEILVWNADQIKIIGWEK